MTDAVPRLTCPTLIAFQRTDMIFPMLDAAAALLPGAETAALPGTATPGATAETAAIMARFLDAP
jgi:pimeloyl-ACP methyl ester carboxylesterase